MQPRRVRPIPSGSVLVAGAITLGLVSAWRILGSGAGPPSRHIAPSGVAPQARVNRSPVADPLALVSPPHTLTDRILNRAKDEARRAVIYDASYVRIPYPGGDVSPDRGACTDVVVRAFRAAGFDLQRLIHDDMQAHFGLYPTRYGKTEPDANIDHRRVWNQMTFFRRHGLELPRSTQGTDRISWRPGDLVYWDLGFGHQHTGIISDVRGDSGLPMVIHNMSRAAQEDVLNSWKIIGHYRYPPTGHPGGIDGRAGVEDKP